ncbi:hypothetical protein BC830DRAFT_810036 [Chytriomyces sp. MP71]|nr:hypothetical protein BC830DRAFT_810036 [Chytriomyces sp. MP71]
MSLRQPRRWEHTRFSYPERKMPSISMAPSQTSSATKALFGAGLSAAKDVVSIIDPYVPATAKTAAAYAIKQTSNLTATASEAFTQTQHQLFDTASVAKATALDVLEKTGAKDALESANAAKDAAFLQAEQIRTSCVETANGVIETANGVRVRAMDLSYQVLEKSGAVDVVNKGVEVVNATNQRVEDAKKSAAVVVEDWKARVCFASSLLSGHVADPAPLSSCPHRLKQLRSRKQPCCTRHWNCDQLHTQKRDQPRSSSR